MKSILEFLVNKPINATNKYNFPLGKEIKLNGNLHDILTKSLKENNFIRIDWTYKLTDEIKRERRCLGIVGEYNDFHVYNEVESKINCKIVINALNKIKIEDAHIGVNNEKESNFRIRYCTKEECEQLEKACKENNIIL